MPRGDAALLQRLQLLAGLEANRLAGGNRDLRAGARVPADARLAGTHVEDAEAAQFNTFTAAEGALHAFENGFDGHLRFGLSYASAINNFVDNVQFDQSRLLVPAMQCKFVPRKLHDRIRVIRLSSDLFRRVCASFATGVCVATTLDRAG